MEKSDALWERAKRVIPGGTQTLSKGPDRFVNGVHPKFIVRGYGSHVWDADGNEYVDFPMGLGAITLGYGIYEVTNAVFDRHFKGPVFTLPCPIEIELAEKLQWMIPSAEMVRFCKNGGDATEGAVRIARAVTGRKHIAYCGYHGCHDWSAITGGLKRGLLPEMDEWVHPFRYNSIESLIRVLVTWDCAAVIMEQGLEEPEVYADKLNFLQQACRIAHERKALFILDEIVTGFRYSMAGAQDTYSVLPDLSCFGKGMANGLPISCIVGKKEYMETINDGVFFSFTFGGDTVAMAAALITLEIMRREEVIRHMWQLGSILRSGIAQMAENAGIEVELRGNPVRTLITFPNPDGSQNLMKQSLFLQETLKYGVLFGVPTFICWKHDIHDIEKASHACYEAFKVMKQYEGVEVMALKGEPVAPPVIRA